MALWEGPLRPWGCMRLDESKTDFYISSDRARVSFQLNKIVRCVIFSQTEINSEHYFVGHLTCSEETEVPGLRKSSQGQDLLEKLWV